MKEIKLNGYPESRYIVYAFTQINGDQEDFDLGYADRFIIESTDSAEEAIASYADCIGSETESDIAIGTLIDDRFCLLSIDEFENRI